MPQNKKITCILSFLYILPLFFLIFLNTFLSLFQTTYMETLQFNEIPLYKADRFYLVILFYIIFIAVLFLLYRKTGLLQKQSKLLYAISLLFTAFICISILVIYKATACCDSEALCELARAFQNGDYSSFTGDNYLVHYPHQVGMIALLEILFTLFGSENYLVFQILNLIAILCIVHFLHRISELLYHNDTLSSLTSILSMGALPLFLYVTFVYGDILGLALALGSITLLIRWLQEHKFIQLVLCCLCIGCSMMLKSNNSIVLVAILIIILLDGILQKKWQFILYTVLFFAFASLISSIPTFYYMQETDIRPFPAGIPKIAWVAMGLQENEEVGDGWYNTYNWAVYTQNHFDSEKTEAVCLESIKASLGYYISEPRQGAYFFYNKFRSQWNDPGYQSQITNEWSSRYQESYTPFYNWLVFGPGKAVVEWMMNLYQFLILVSALIAIPTLIQSRNWNLARVLLPLCIFGGYLFHMFWEAQGRYALPYFIMMLPLAAAGLFQVLSLISNMRYRTQSPD